MGNTTNTCTLTNLINEIPDELFIHIMEYYDIRIIYFIYKEELLRKTLDLSRLTRCIFSHPDLKDKDLNYILDNCV